jgi:hypothetical protein
VVAPTRRPFPTRLGVLLKYQDDIAHFEGTKVKEMLDDGCGELRAAE